MAQSILIVDDEKDIVSMLNQYFYKIGYVVYTAINGKEALNAITKNPRYYSVGYKFFTI